MQLRYEPFRACAEIVAAHHEAPPLRWGARGPGVRVLQAGLQQLGYRMPGSLLPKGVPDGIFGKETVATLKRYQERHKSWLEVDGVAGRKTIGLIDVQLSMLAAPAPAPHKPAPAPPKPRPAMSATYRLGNQDPPYTADVGAGAFKSTPAQATYTALAASIVASLPVAYFYVGDDAAKHLWHYFLSTGNTLTIDLEGMVRDVLDAKKHYETEVWLARQFVEQLPTGQHDIVAQNTRDSYNTEDQSRNWYFALGGYHTWGRGNAVVKESGGRRSYELDFEYRLRDRYNWDGGKSVTIRKQKITDEFMAEFHRQGLAREFDCIGSFRRQFSWNERSVITPEQMHTPPGRA